MSDLIDHIDKYKKGWNSGLPETPCGHGSKIANTAKQREWIPEMIDRYHIKSIADIGAGDLNWMNKVKLPIDVSYRAFDLVPRHPSVNSFNLLTSIPPKSDMLMCLWVLNHFPENDANLAFDNLLKSNSKYLLITQRETWVKYDLEIVDMLILNEKKDVLILAKL